MESPWDLAKSGALPVNSRIRRYKERPFTLHSKTRKQKLIFFLVAGSPWKKSARTARDRYAHNFVYFPARLPPLQFL